MMLWFRFGGGARTRLPMPGRARRRAARSTDAERARVRAILASLVASLLFAISVHADEIEPETETPRQSHAEPVTAPDPEPASVFLPCAAYASMNS